MKNTNSNRHKNSRGGGNYAALGILAVILLAVGGYFLFSPAPRPPAPPAAVSTPTPKVVEAPPQQTAPRPVAPPPQQSKPEYPDEPVQPAMTSLPPKTKSGAGARLAIIIDDMGASMHEARALADIGVPLTFSIIPGLRSYREVAAFSAAKSIETMIHIPMQSKEWPKRRLESNGLLVSMSGEDIRGHMLTYLRDIPGAAGANNHMGSEFTEHGEQMKAVLGVLKEKGLFFVDSVTSPQTVGYRLAKDMGIKSARRNVFLDNEQNSAYIQGQLDQAVRLAKKSGAAIAICHPHPATIKTLANALPALQKQGVTIVPASALVR